MIDLCLILSPALVGRQHFARKSTGPSDVVLRHKAFATVYLHGSVVSDQQSSVAWILVFYDLKPKSSVQTMSHLLSALADIFVISPNCVGIGLSASFASIVLVCVTQINGGRYLTRFGVSVA